MDVASLQNDSGQENRTGTSQSIDWFAEGESRTVDVDGIQVVVKYIGRKGRRARISITAPMGAVFESSE